MEEKEKIKIGVIGAGDCGHAVMVASAASLRGAVIDVLNQNEVHDLKTTSDKNVGDFDQDLILKKRSVGPSLTYTLENTSMKTMDPAFFLKADENVNRPMRVKSKKEKSKAKSKRKQSNKSRKRNRR